MGRGINSRQIQDGEVKTDDIEDGGIFLVDLSQEVLDAMGGGGGGFPFEIIIGQVLINEYQQMPVFGMCDIQGELQIDGSFILEI